MSGPKASINNYTLVLSLPQYTAYGSLLEIMTIKSLMPSFNFLMYIREITSHQPHQTGFSKFSYCFIWQHCLIIYIQLFRERLSEKVHVTIPKGIVSGFECTVLQRNLKKMAREATDINIMFASAKGKQHWSYPILPFRLLHAHFLRQPFLKKLYTSLFARFLQPS